MRTRLVWFPVSLCPAGRPIGAVQRSAPSTGKLTRHCSSQCRCAHQHASCYDADHSCFNGGKCIPGLEDIYGTGQYFCDCSDAVDADGKQFVGKYCELKAIEACDSNGEKFCVNNGTCSVTAATSDIDFCECGSGFEGPHCEFEKGKVPDCDLTCMNKGKCALGIKDYALAELGYNDFWDNHVQAMYCQCPPDAFGAKCEVSAQVCGDHHCFNGAAVSILNRRPPFFIMRCS